MTAPREFVQGFVAGVAWIWWFVGDGGKLPNAAVRRRIVRRWRKEAHRAWERRDRWDDGEIRSRVRSRDA